MYALIDCNNFYASCERLFRPDLRNKPIVVLSNNDGCVIARSNESKTLGIAMGEPFFKIKTLCKQNQVFVFSSNYTLYGDLSNRVMRTIEQTWPHYEIYSIDEAFLDLSNLPAHQHDAFCLMLQKKILKEIGIPTAIGIGQTKTLAKIANHCCKKIFKIPVFNVSTSLDGILKQVAVADIWGVGQKWSKKLMDQGIYTAFDLASMDVHLLKKQFNVVMMRTAMELKGMSCGGIEEAKPKQSIISSRSFGAMHTDFTLISQFISSHCALAVEKLRKEHLNVKRISVFLQTNRFREDLAQQNESSTLSFINPTDDLRLITQAAKQCLHRLFKRGYHYKKAGICLEELVPKGIRQLDLFHKIDDETLERTEQFMSVFDKINQKFGRSTIRLAAEGYPQSCGMRTQMKSPAYTTRWSDLPMVIL